MVALTIITELLQISVYGDNSMSASLALIFAVVLIAGMPGVVVISATIAIVDQIRTGRPLSQCYKVTFNWATHILGGAMPAVLLGITSVRIDAVNLITLVLMTTIAGLAYYVIDSILISAAISLSKQASIVRTWQAQFRWLAGHYVALSVMGLFLSIAYHALGYLGILVFVLPMFMMRYAQQQYVARTQDGVRELRRMNRELTHANRDIVGANTAIQQLNQRLQILNDELFITLGLILDARDPYVGGHAAQVATYAVAIATELGLPPERLALVRQAAYLHDIGKIAISEQILHKPDKLTDAE